MTASRPLRLLIYGSCVSRDALGATPDPRIDLVGYFARSAMASGCVDYVLRPAEMPARLLAYMTHALAPAGWRPPHRRSPVAGCGGRKLPVSRIARRTAPGF